MKQQKTNVGVARFTGHTAGKREGAKVVEDRRAALGDEQNIKE
jgi:hypothetical protein